MAIVLPTEKTQINKDFKSQKFLMLGSAGIGKSAFWASDPKALFIETESGLNALEVFKLSIRSWQDLREAYTALKLSADSGKFPYDIIIVDTVDRLVDFAQEETIARAKEFYKKIEINTIGDLPQGAGWYKVKEMVMGFFNRLELLPCALALIAHSDIKRIKDTNSEFDKNTISIGGQLGDDILALPDHTLHIESHRIGDRIQRVVYTIPTQSREAKSRGGMIPSGLKWGDNTVENYKNFRSLFR
jgi:hypothetical protein